WKHRRASREHDGRRWPVAEFLPELSPISVAHGGTRTSVRGGEGRADPAGAEWCAAPPVRACGARDARARRIDSQGDVSGTPRGGDTRWEEGRRWPDCCSSWPGSGSGWPDRGGKPPRWVRNSWPGGRSRTAATTRSTTSKRCWLRWRCSRTPPG